MLRSSAVLLLLVFFTACSGANDGEHDLVADAEQETVSVYDLTPLDAPPALDVDPIADRVGPPESGARAIVIDDPSQLIGGREALGDLGDFLLENDVVRFIVRGKERGLYSPFGASLVDADLVRGKGSPGNDRLFEMFPLAGLIRTLHPSSMEVLDSGEESGTAVVRFQGTDGGIPLIDSVFPTQHLGLAITVDFVLRSEVRHLEIVTTLSNPTDAPLTVPAGDIVFFGDSLMIFSHRCGTDTDCTLGRSDIDWFAAAGEGVSYGLTAPAALKLEVPLTREEILPVLYGNFEIGPGEEVAVKRFFIVGDGTVDSVASYAWGLRGVNGLASCSVPVQLADVQSTMEEIFIEAIDAATDPPAPVSATRPDGEGVATLHLPAGLYDLVLHLPGAPPVVQTGVTVSPDAPLEIPMQAAPAGWLHVTTAGPDGAAMTTKLCLQAGHQSPWTAGVAETILVKDGEVTVPVLAGEYTATVSRGFEFGIAAQDITVTAGQVAELAAALTREVETPGWISLDTHNHCELSIDSNLLVEDKIYDAIAEGVEVFAITDHDHFGTLQPRIESLGLTKQVHCIAGNEVSPLYGHQIGVGCKLPEFDQYFSLDWTDSDEQGTLKTPSEIWNELHEVWDCGFVAVAHPYCSQAMFEFYHIDETTDPATLDPAVIDLGLLDGIELINSHDEWDEVFTQNLPGWFNLLNHGLLLPAIGSSDSHQITQSMGHPRNLVMSANESPDAVDEDELLDAVKSFRSQIFGGPFILLTIDGQGLGETVVATDGAVTLHVEVRAPSWMQVDYVRIFAGGVLIAEPVPESGGVLRLSADIEHQPMSDTYYVVAAGSETATLGPVARGRPPISLTNPIWVTVD